MELFSPEILEALLAHAHLAPDDLTRLACVSKAARDTVRDHWAAGPIPRRLGLPQRVVAWECTGKKRASCQVCDARTEVVHPLHPDRHLCLDCLRYRAPPALRLVSATRAKARYLLDDADLETLPPVVVVRNPRRKFFVLEHLWTAALHRFKGMAAYRAERARRTRHSRFAERAARARRLILEVLQLRHDALDRVFMRLAFEICADVYARNGTGGLGRVRIRALLLKFIAVLATPLTRQLGVFETVATAYVDSQGDVSHLDRWLRYQPRAQTLVDALMAAGCRRIPRHSMAMHSYIAGGRDDLRNVVAFVKNLWNDGPDSSESETSASEISSSDTD